LAKLNVPMTGFDPPPLNIGVRKTPPKTLSVEQVELFPTRIWQSRLTSLAPHFPAWVAAVNGLRNASPEPAGRSNRLGWNSADTAILNRREFDELHGAIRACCLYALQQMGRGDRRFGLESWINIHDRGGFNFLHMHDGAVLSGVFYLQAPPGSGRLVFRDPRSGPINAPFKGAGANAHNEVQLQPEAGLVALFPNWLEHYVEPHQNDLPRIAISFNAL
jgi:uncharacterized protein (TIGR02466 family)